LKRSLINSTKNSQNRFGKAFCWFNWHWTSLSFLMNRSTRQ